MIKQIKKAVMVPLLILILAGGPHYGCGRKAPPKPPSKDKPSTVNKIAPFYSLQKKWTSGLEHRCLELLKR